MRLAAGRGLDVAAVDKLTYAGDPDRYEAMEWIELGQYRVDANRGAGMTHFFLALHARHVTNRNADDLEEQHLLHFTRPELEAALDTGQFKALPWVAIVALALRRL